MLDSFLTSDPTLSRSYPVALSRVFSSVVSMMRISHFFLEEITFSPTSLWQATHSPLDRIIFTKKISLTPENGVI